jgi:U3 small nucleolar RNA-associated protein 11
VDTQSGVHVQDRGNTALPVDVVKLLKTQDENYVRTQRSKDLKVMHFYPDIWNTDILP